MPHFYTIGSLSTHGGEWRVFISPPTYFSYYENSSFALCLESSTLFRDQSRKIVEKIPLSSIMGDFYLVRSSEPLYQLILSLFHSTGILYQIFLEIKRFLFHRHTLREIAWFVDISTERARDMIRPELEYDHFEERIELGYEWIELDRICVDMLVCISSCYDTDDWTSASSDLLSG
jgi:hypothetical protein